jgi:hypothetical protein
VLHVHSENFQGLTPVANDTTGTNQGADGR